MNGLRENVVKIYAVKDQMAGDEIVFRELVYANPMLQLSSEGIAVKKQGGSIKARWGVDSLEKPIGTYIRMSCYGLTTERETIEKIWSENKFFDRNVVNHIEVEGETRKFSMIQPIDHQEGESKFEHVFTMFEKHSALLATERFVEYWKSCRFTGAVFEHVDDLPDEFFES